MYRSLIFLVVLAFGMAYPLKSRAEGGCPPGFYPIGGQGVKGCAPIPGSTPGNQRPAKPPAAPVPTGRWHDAWGAVALSKATSWVGASTDEPSRSRAEGIALQKCRAEGASDCTVLSSYHNQCFALMVPAAKENFRWGSGTGENIETATQIANRACMTSSGDACKIFYTDCAEPTFEKF
jgi:hypothetical protein